MADHLLEIRDLRVRFDTPSGPVHAVRGVSLAVLPRSAWPKLTDWRQKAFQNVPRG